MRRSPRVQRVYKFWPAAGLVEQIMIMEKTHGVEMHVSHATANPETAKPTNTPTAPGSHIQDDGHQSDVDNLPSSSSAMSADTASEPLAVLIPEEARFGPLKVFRSRDGRPPGITDEDIA